jgi:hypothetical protein
MKALQRDVAELREENTKLRSKLATIEARQGHHDTETEQAKAA